MSTRLQTPAHASGAPPSGTVAGRGVHPALFVGLVVTAVGGPLALVVQNVPSGLQDVPGSAGVAMVIAIVAFAPVVLVWLAYLREVRGPGGLSAFVEAAAGRAAGRTQAVVWLVSYLAYLLYTVGYVVGDVLPVGFPGVERHVGGWQVGLAVVLVVVALLPLRICLALLGVLAVGQIALVVALGTVAGGHPVAASPAPGPTGPTVAYAGATTALLLTCAGLPVFLSGEVRERLPHGGSLRRSLAAGVGVAVAVVGVGATVVVGASRVGDLRAELPGAEVAAAAGGGGLARAVVAGTAASTLALLVVEFLALTRLLSAVTPLSIRQVSRGLAVALILANTATAGRPDLLFDRLLKTSLIALWLSQLPVLALYPRFRARVARCRAVDVALALAGTALMGFGLYVTVFRASGS